MKRQAFNARLYDDNGTLVSETTKYAWNSAITATEDLMRAKAREYGRMAHADKPSVDGGVGTVYYRRNWTLDGIRFVAVVSKGV